MLMNGQVMVAYFQKDEMMNNSEILIYRNPDGKIKIDVRLEEETVWLTQEHMAELFGKAKSTINMKGTSMIFSVSHDFSCIPGSVRGHCLLVD